jgi:protease PrsW
MFNFAVNLQILFQTQMLPLSLALTPVLIIILFVYFQDKYSKEPKLTLFVAFLLGVVSVVPAIILETGYELLFNFTTGVNVYVTILYAFFGVGLTEELCKFLFLRIYIYKNKNFDEPMDGVVYAVMVSMGFAAIENVHYILYSHDPIGTAIARSLTAVPAHATFGVIMGLYFGMSRFTYQRKRFKYLALSILLATLAHGFYDVFLFLPCQYCPLLSLVVLIICIIISLRIISKYKRISPFKKRYVLFTHRRRIITAEELENNEVRKKQLREKLKNVFKKKRLRSGDTSSREDF